MRIALHLDATTAGLTAAIGALQRANVEEMRTLRTSSSRRSILDGTVRYRREPIGREDWRTRERVLLDGWGDCEDLAAALAAELEVAGYPAHAVVRRAHGGRGYHAVVRLHGRELDPSRWLGM